MLQRWNITKQMVHVVLRDNARNMARALDDCAVNSLGCMAHTLQLALNEAVLSQRAVSDCIAIGRKIASSDEPASFSAHQWTMVENMLTLLDPRDELTRNISQASATAGDVIPSIQAITRLLKQTVPTDHEVKISKDTI